jgi:hypothetical protein
VPSLTPAEGYRADTAVLNWRERLVCSRSGSRNVDVVVTGTERWQPVFKI